MESITPVECLTKQAQTEKSVLVYRVNGTEIHFVVKPKEIKSRQIKKKEGTFIRNETQNIES